MMPVAWTDLLAILNGIAAQRHSGTVAVAVGDLVCSQPFLHFQDYLWLWKELIRASIRVGL